MYDEGRDGPMPPAAVPALIGTVRYSGARTWYLKALLAAQTSFYTLPDDAPEGAVLEPLIPKDRVAKVKGETSGGKSYEYTFKYADIAMVLQAIMPALLGAGLVVEQHPTFEPEGQSQAMWLLTRITHVESGEWAESAYLIASAEAIKKETHLKISGRLTAVRRYAICPMVGVAAEEAVESTEEEDLNQDPNWRASMPQSAPSRTEERRGPPRSRAPAQSKPQTTEPANALPDAPGIVNGKVVDVDKFLNYADDLCRKAGNLDMLNEVWTTRIEPYKGLFVPKVMQQLTDLYNENKAQIEG